MGSTRNLVRLEIALRLQGPRWQRSYSGRESRIFVLSQCSGKPTRDGRSSQADWACGVQNAHRCARSGPVY